jgi:allophanate hydrolase subunit 2
MYGQYTFETKNGPRTLAFERGTVVSVTGAGVTVKATDGTTWTWTLSSTSVLRENGARTTAKSLAAGQAVLAAGPVTGTTRDARLVVIRASSKS